MSRNVFIVADSIGYEDMYEEFGWKCVETLDDADLIQFTGGEDVSPNLYNQARHVTTYCNPDRDRYEKLVFQYGLDRKLPMAGICRGGQFLNVMCGGALYQDVDNHGIYGTHQVMDIKTGEIFDATSTHHQMMKPGEHGVLIGVAIESTRKEECSKKGAVLRFYQRLNWTSPTEDLDVEVVYYPDQKVFCFQPHPEYYGQEKLAEVYMNYLDTYLLT